LADAVKITVIATGFQPQYAPVPEEPAKVLGETSAPYVIRTESGGEGPSEPAAVVNGEPEPRIDPEDLDTPAYLRQGRLLN